MRRLVVRAVGCLDLREVGTKRQPSSGGESTRHQRINGLAWSNACHRGVNGC